MVFHWDIRQFLGRFLNKKYLNMAIPRRFRAEVMNSTMAIYANDSQLTVKSL